MVVIKRGRRATTKRQTIKVKSEKEKKRRKEQRISGKNKSARIKSG